MRQYLILLLFSTSIALLPSQVYGQKKSNSNANERDILDFLNSTQGVDSSETLVLMQDAEINTLVKVIKRVLVDTNLTPNEREYLAAQLDRWPHYKWKNGTIRNTRVISEKEITRLFKKKYDGWPEFREKYGKGLTGFSVPLFTADKSKCLFFRSYSCGGLCGEGAAFIYVKVAGRWKIAAVYPDWIS